MRRSIFRVAPIAAALAVLLALPASADLRASTVDAPAADTIVVPEGTALMPRVEKRHSGTFNGKSIQFRSVVEEVPVTDSTGNLLATVGSISYVREGNDSNRPVIFAFNGGPGSSSIWLHMGYLGPVRPDYGAAAGEDEVRPPTVAPFGFVANPESPLDVADVVLIDPPGTGFARIHGQANATKVLGVDEDAKVVTQFIGEWLRRNGRSNSPKYLIGESYGTIRAAEVAKLLSGGPFGTGRMDGITLNGVMLLGQAMDGSRRTPETHSANNLSAFAATAWYHNKVPRTQTLEQHVERARAFTANTYIPALYAGSRLPQAQRQAVAQELAGLTGFPVQRVLELDLRLTTDVVMKELLRDADLEAGGYDARFTLPLKASAGDTVADDPAMGQYVPVYIGVLDKHLRQNLGVQPTRAYNAIEFTRINSVFWKGPPLSKNHAASLATAMRRNPQLRVLVGTGYFDLMTTVGSAEAAVALSGMDPSRVTMAEYTSGHMPYIGKQSRAQLARDVRAFVTADQAR